MRRAGHARIQEHDIGLADLAHGIERAARLRIAEAGQRRAHQLAAVVIAGNGGEGNFERRQELFQVLVFGSERRIDEVAGDHDQIRPRRETVQRRDAAGQRCCGVDAPIGKLARPFDVQIGNLRDQERTRAHGASPGSRRIDGRIDGEADAVAGFDRDRIRHVDGDDLGGGAADPGALPVADKTDAVHLARKRGAVGRDDADRFRADHGKDRAAGVTVDGVLT